MTSSRDSNASNSRRAKRKTMRTLGEIVPHGHDHGMECTVLDMSGTGARLRISVVRKAFQPDPDVPAAFKLVIARDNLVVDCQRAWRDGETVGVSFASAFRQHKGVQLKAAVPKAAHARRSIA